MHRRRRRSTTVGWITLALVTGLVAGPAVAQPRAVLEKLNDHHSVKGTEQSKSYRLLFDAFLQLDPPPMEISASFNLATIHPKMSDWAVVSSWAESNGGMADAILQCTDRNILGLPYGIEQADSKYRDANLVAAIGVGGSLRQNEFRYLGAIEVIAAYATAERV